MKVEVIYMKKRFCLFVVLLILSGLTIAFATGIDFSSYSDAELISIVEQLNAELVARGISKTASITPGSYLVGRDIPAGKYVLKNDTEGTAYYLIYKDDLIQYVWQYDKYHISGRSNLPIEEIEKILNNLKIR